MNEFYTVIGDVHGEVEMLRKLLELIPKTHRLIFLGDLPHKGLYTKKVVYEVRMLVDAGRAEVIKGNHEDMVGKKAWEDAEAGLTDEDKAWLKSRPLFLRKKIDGKWNFFVHGGVDRDSSFELISDLFDLNKEWTAEYVDTTLSQLSKTKRRKIEKVMRTRFLRPEGGFVTYKSETEEDTWWAQRYDGKFGHAWYGHQPFDKIREDAYATGIDTGACEGGYLTAVCINTGDIYSTN
jgi:serine/threonine protein phosphatase 1